MDQFHSPKNLAIALSVEAAELLEHFQWMPEAEAANMSSDQKSGIREEVADVFLYLIRLADKLEIDLLAAAIDKIRLNAKKYPVEKARGSSKKIHGALTFCLYAGMFISMPKQWPSKAKISRSGVHGRVVVPFSCAAAAIEAKIPRCKRRRQNKR